MRLALVTSIVSPHQLPLARQLAARLGDAQFRYVATQPLYAYRAELGWSGGESPAWVLEPWRGDAQAREAAAWLREAEVVLCGNRDLELLAQRAAAGRPLLYMAERWFKPPLGRLRCLHPGFLRMALRFRRLAQSPHVHHLAIGQYAARDMRAVCRLPGRHWLWGYFVDAPATPVPGRPRAGALQILWAGRMVGLKRVDTLLRALAACRAAGADCRVRLVGGGEQEGAWRRLAARLGCSDRVQVDPPMPIAQVRAAMRAADVFVLASNGYEGWGAVLNEAMLEGCCVVSSDAPGGAITLLRPGENGLLFRPGDIGALTRHLLSLERDDALRQRLAAAGQRTVRELWTPEVAAERLLALGEALLAGRTPPAHAEGPLQLLE